jgi:signal transduction histidine kinase
MDPPLVNSSSANVSWWQRLYVRLYLAVLVSLVLMGVVFALWHIYTSGEQHNRYGLIVFDLLVALAGAMGAYPVVRRLTRRLERLQASVDALGTGQLSTRVAVEGNDEIASLANSFNRSAARIQALMAAQKTLLSNASHELRSPLTRIRMAIELMQDQAAQPEVRDELTRSIAELDQLIDEILLASRLDAAPDALPSPTHVDLTALVAEECATVDAQLEAQAVSMRGDPTLLRRMTRNLLENARRYGEGTPITVRLGINSDQAIELDVLDNGPGIPDSERENIFAPFYRLPGASEQSGGVGLGLSLVRQIATAHGGGVHYVSPRQGGSCFRVVLPQVP